MGKTKISRKRQRSSGRLSKVNLNKIRGLTLADPLKELIDPQKTALAILECLQNNDPDGVMEMIAIYLEAKNKADLIKGNSLPKSTMYSALKHKNPTIKTLAKIMSTRGQRKRLRTKTI
jgi:DNA-binding phage protein